MALYRTQGIVIGRRALGESDRLVDFYTRDHGRVRGVARSARRTRSRFGSTLELFTLGELCFFDTGRSELVRIDHFDIVHPFVRVREHRERLGQGAWVVECLARLSPDRDPQPALFGLALRSLRALDAGARPPRVAACFAVRAVDLLGHRPRSTAAWSAAGPILSRRRRWTPSRGDSCVAAAGLAPTPSPSRAR